jgi:NAD-dependent DNA ligase
MDNRDALVGLNMIEGVGPVRVRQLLEHFGEANAILRASRQELLRVHGIGDDTATAIAGWEKLIDLPGELKRIEDIHATDAGGCDHLELFGRFTIPDCPLA